jgi:hypothetical protein
MPSYRSELFSSIHEIVYFGNGGYDWGTVYNMPVWLRRFTYQKILEHILKTNENQEQASTTAPRLPGPDIKPSYSTKVSSK